MLSEQPTWNRKVFKHEGTTEGQGAVATGGAGAALVVVPGRTWVWVSVTGQTVVETSMVTTVVMVDRCSAGQSVTAAAQLVMVWVEVVKMVEVVRYDVVMVVVTLVTDETDAAVDEAAATVLVVVDEAAAALEVVEDDTAATLEDEVVDDAAATLEDDVVDEAAATLEELVVDDAAAALVEVEVTAATVLVLVVVLTAKVEVVLRWSLSVQVVVECVGVVRWLVVVLLWQLNEMVETWMLQVVLGLPWGG